MRMAAVDRRLLPFPLGARLLFFCFCLGAPAGATVIRVPQDHSTIQAAINAAQDGDTVLVSRGTYSGGLVLSGKTITLASEYINTSDPSDITQTIIDGGTPILRIENSVGAATTVQGLTFQNGDYQLVNHARRVNILNNRFISGGSDQISFEGAGGLVRDCHFDTAGDDGIDVDQASDPTIENNTILNSRNDGIEIRLHSYTGPGLEITIRNNYISGAREDGIQLIDYAGLSSRVFRIEGNVIVGNAMVGLGCMPDGISNEDFGGAPLQEEVQVVNNTFSGSPYGLTGGDNMLLLNNVFVGSTQVAVKRVAGASVVTHTDFWANGTDHSGSNVDTGTTLLQDPLLDASYNLMEGSPCIDAGAASIVWNGKTVSAPPYSGAAPDLGARETASGPALPTVTVTATDGSAAELGPDPGTFIVSRTGDTSTPLTVDYSVDGTATEGTDYGALLRSVTIDAGAPSAPVTVAPFDDAEPEPTETVVLTLSAGAAYTVGSPSSATVSIADDDTVLPTVMIAVTEAIAAEAGPDPGTFTVSRTGEVSPPLAVEYVVGGDATNGVDYQTIGTSVTIPAGSSTASITITPIDDAVMDDEEVVLTLAASPSYVVGSPGGASLTIQDNDTTVSFQDGLSPSSGYAGTRDTHISEAKPRANFGTASAVRVDGDVGSGKDLVGLLMWDVSSIPAGSAVQAVTITFEVTDKSGKPYEVYEVRRPWLENQATWNVYATGANWSTPGAKGSLDRGSTVLGTVSGSALGSYVLTLNASGVALVQSWVDNPSANNGILIANAANADGLAVNSRNASTAAKRPKLAVTYAPGATAAANEMPW